MDILLGPQQKRYSKDILIQPVEEGGKKKKKNKIKIHLQEKDI